jgi:hypothetical protein
MNRSALTYSGALAILGQHEHPAVERLNAAAGAGLLVTATIFPPALALFDAKNEAVLLLKGLLDKTSSRIRTMGGRDRQDLILAAHTVLCIAALLASIQDIIGPHYKALALTDKEVLASSGARGSSEQLIDQLMDLELPLPSENCGFEENIRYRLKPHFQVIADQLVHFCEGLSAWSSLRLERSSTTKQISDLSIRKYRSSFWRLAAQVPDIQIWMAATEHRATRVRLNSIMNEVTRILDGQAASLAQLHDLLAVLSPSDRPPRASIRGLLARAASSVLAQPLLRTAFPPAGVAFPTVAKGFITPHFRLASAEDDEPISQREWWKQWPLRRDLDRFLTAHLAHPDSCQMPLVVLGHPGAGKSLLTEVLAARLPSQGFTVIHVPLRYVHADDKLVNQIEHAIRMKLKQPVSWGELSNECSSTIRVVILDGLDELIQATGVTQSGYLTEVRSFQQSEYDLGRSVAFIVTSRTVVLDRVRIPAGCPLVRLENFDEPQLISWMTAWNQANSDTAAFRPLEKEQLLSYGELALQPLLLTMIAIHAAHNKSTQSTSLDGDSPSRLYRQLLDDSIRRQVIDKPEIPPADEDLPGLLASRRWLLSIAAFAMFNRGRQDVSEDELNEDCDALSGRMEKHQPHSLGSPISRAQMIISDFFFVHVAGSDQLQDSSDKGAGSGRRSYEFLHSTFGEFLIGERILKILDALAQGRAIVAAEPSMREVLDTGRSQIRLFLSHRPLLNREGILDFLAEMFTEIPKGRQDAILDVLAELIKSARDSLGDEFRGYDPSPRDVVCRLASYTVNLITMRLRLEGAPIPLKKFAPTGSDPLPWWQSTVRLWHAGLEPEGWTSVLSAIRPAQILNESIGGEIRIIKTGTETLTSEELAERGLLFVAL